MKLFKFYTYDSRGRDLVVRIEAENQDDAWVIFDKKYGTDVPVDSVKEE